MQKLTEAFHGIVELERHRNEGPEQEPMFLSWTTDMFCEFSLLVGYVCQWNTGYPNKLDKN